MRAERGSSAQLGHTFISSLPTQPGYETVSSAMLPRTVVRVDQSAGSGCQATGCSGHGASVSDRSSGRVCAELLSMLLRPTVPSLAAGVVVAAAAIALETLFAVFLQHRWPGEAFEPIYLLGILAVSTVWGLGLALATSLASATVLAYVRYWPGGHFTPFVVDDGVIVVVFSVVALCTNFVAGLARVRAREAEQRRREAEAVAVKLHESRDRLTDLAEQQGALRRVATLVASAVDPSDLFAAVADEMARCVEVDNAAVLHYTPDGAAVVVSGRYEPALEPRSLVGQRYSLEGDNVAVKVLATGRPARIDDHRDAAGSLAARSRELGIRCVVGCPILVDGRLWGLAVVGSTRTEPLPADTEARLGDFADLVATAVANAATRDELQASRDELAELAERQAALRRVATLVARGVEPAGVFHAVAEEIVRCLHVDVGAVWRYDSDGSVVLMAVCHPPATRFTPVGQRMMLEGDSAAALVWRSGSAARIDSFDIAVGQIAQSARADGVASAVGVPVVVDGRLWGVAVAASYRLEPPPPDSEERIGDFADLVATALANAATRDELIASRARIVAAADDGRRRLERDLHDGAQQRLVALGLQLRLVEGSAPPELRNLKAQLAEAVAGLAAVSNELQQISRGIHPVILSTGGLGPALKTLARRCPVPVSLDVDVGRRLPEPVEVAAYYVVAEALTNTAKYAHASAVNICVETKGANLFLSIKDDGIGGADVSNGSGLIGLQDRVAVLGGHMQIDSAPGCGTSLHITIPVEDTDR
jgi:signal transduction histidine kinase